MSVKTPKEKRDERLAKAHEQSAHIDSVLNEHGIVVGSRMLVKEKVFKYPLDVRIYIQKHKSKNEIKALRQITKEKTVANKPVRDAKKAGRSE